MFILTQRLRSGTITLPRESDGDGIGVPSHTAQDEAADRWKRLPYERYANLQARPPNLFKFMALHFQPNFGQILICDFPSQFTPPEMIKRRPVVCVSPKYRNRYGVATVVPLSTTEPKVKSQFNVSVRLEQCINDEYPTLQCWAKCDMLYTLNYSRLNAPLLGKREGKRQYNFMVLPPGTMCGILTGILAGLGIEGSVKYEGDTYKVFNLPFLDTTTTLW